MSWAGISNNQTVSKDNLQDGINTSVFQSKSTITGTLSEQVTKSDAEAYVYLNTGTAAWTALSSNQLPVKSDFTAASCYNVTIYASMGASYNDDLEIKYAIGTGDYITTALLTAGTTSCTQFTTVCCPQGEAIYFIINTSTNVSVCINGTANSTTCPSNSNAFGCYFGFTPTGNTNVALTVYVDGGGAVYGCTNNVCNG